MTGDEPQGDSILDTTMRLAAAQAQPEDVGHSA